MDSKMKAEVYKELNIGDSADELNSNERAVVFRMLRNSEGTHIYVKSPEFYKFFESLSGGQKNESVSIGWGTEMGAWDVNRVLADQMFDGTQISNYVDASEFVPQTLRDALIWWNHSDDTSRSSPQVEQILLQGERSGQYINYNYAYPEGDDRVGWGIPNLAFLLSDKLADGIKVKYSAPISNRTFDLYFRMVQEYFKFINEVIQPREKSFVLTTCSNAIPKMDVDGTLKYETFDEHFKLI